MNGFLSALQFLTVVPAKITEIEAKKIAWSLVYFPLVGLLLGLGLSGISHLLAFLGFGRLASSVILVTLLILFTGGLHLDGLADTADAFLSGKNKEEMLKIMHDSHIGTMGVLSLISIILLKISFLSSVNTPLQTISLILMCVLSRWSLVFAIFLFPYARKEGKAKVFMQGIDLRIFTLATVTCLVLSLLIWQLKGILVFGAITMGTYILGKCIAKKLDGITGDSLGAINEFMEVATLLCICLLEGA